MRRLTTGVGCVLLGLATSLSAQTLRDAVEAAWRLNADTTRASSGLGEAAGQRDVAQGWLAAPPSASLSRRSDRFGADAGLQVDELELELPLWRRGQQQTRRGLAEANVELAEAELALARWQLAGEVREAVFAVALGAIELDSARRRLEVVERIEKEVGRHVAVGDLARADLLLTQSEKAAALASVADAEQRAEESRQRYVVLTGLAGWTLPKAGGDPAAAPGAQLDAHPRLRRAAAERQRADRAGDNARESANAPYALILGAERERPRYGDANHTALRLGVKIPFAGALWNRPELAAANTRRSRAELDENAARRAVDSDIALARTALRAAESALAAARTRLAAAEEHTGLLRKGFALGESGLAALLRAESLLLDARAAAARQQLQLGQAHHRLEHHLGLLP